MRLLSGYGAVHNRIAAALLAGALAAVIAVPLRATTDDNDAALRAAVERLVDAWNRHDMATFADVFAPDADFVNVTATYMNGRQAIIDHHAPSHRDGWMSHSTLFNTITRVHPLSPTIGIVESQWTMTMNGWLGRMRPRHGEMTIVLQNDDGGWRIVSAHNTDAAVPIGDPADWLLLAIIGGGIGAVVAAWRPRALSTAVAGAWAGMFCLGVPFAIFFWDAPIGGGAFGFGVLGSIVGLVVGAVVLRRRNAGPR